MHILLLLMSACFLISCENIDEQCKPIPSEASEARVFALGGTGGVGTLAQIDLKTQVVHPNFLAGVVTHNNTTMRYFDGKLYIINRGADNITIVDIEKKNLIAQISTGAGSNPMDVALVGKSMYVCSYAAKEILVINQEAPAAIPLRIDISSYDADGHPNCDSIVYTENRIFASIGMVDSSFTSKGGKLLVIDPRTNSVESEIELTFHNPFGMMTVTKKNGPFKGNILLSTTDFISQGCIEQIDPLTRTSIGCLILNTDLGGYSSELHEYQGKLAIAVTLTWPNSKLLQVSHNGVLNDESITPTEQQVGEFAVCPNGEIVVNDSATGGLNIYSNTGKQLTTCPIDIGLPTTYLTGAIICI